MKEGKKITVFSQRNERRKRMQETYSLSFVNFVIFVVKKESDWSK